MKRSEMLIDVPGIGEVLLEPFNYQNGREGYMCIVKSGDKTREFNLTINPLDLNYHKVEDAGEIYLKMYDEAEIVSRHLLNTTDMFKKVNAYQVGVNWAQVTTLNKDYYDKVS